MNCPVCEEDNWKLASKHNDGHHEYYECAHCGPEVTRLHPLIDFEYACRIYNDDYLKNFGIREIVAPGERKSDFAGFTEKGSTFLEFGPGLVTPALWLKELGCHVDIVDINEASRRMFSERGFSVWKVVSDVQRASKYDVVYSYHYIEHVLNVRLEIGIHCLLGKTVIAEIPTGLFETNNPDHNWLLSEGAWVKIISRFGSVVKAEKKKYRQNFESMCFTIKSNI